MTVNTMSQMNLTEQIITIALLMIATMATRFLPFLVFSGKKKTPAFVKFLGNALPAATFAMLIVYCLKNVSIIGGSHGIPELIGIGVTAGLHLWRKNTLLSIFAGTVVYMLLIQLVF
ncbi:MAG: branched-chain amino acid transporter permease [Clostridia bacterium]|nr:branched-chain amino acid transporter permease [Clostridia bacterium]